MRWAFALLVLASAACEKRARDHASPSPSATAPAVGDVSGPVHVVSDFRPVLLVFCASWAAPCARWNALAEDPRIIRDAQIRLYDLTTETPETTEITERRHVDSVPAVLVVTWKGAEVARFRGLPSADELYAAIARAR